MSFVITRIFFSLSVVEFEVFFGDAGDDVGETEAVEFDDDDTMSLEVLYLALDAYEGSAEDAHLTTWLGEVVVILPSFALLVGVFTCLGIDEVHHFAVGYRKDLCTFILVVLHLRHELQGGQRRVAAFEFTDYFLPYLDEDEIGEYWLCDDVKFLFLHLFAIFQSEICCETLLVKSLTDIECFSCVGMTDTHWVPTYLAVCTVVIRTEIIITTDVVAVNECFHVGNVRTRVGVSRASSSDARLSGFSSGSHHNNVENRTIF